MQVKLNAKICSISMLTEVGNRAFVCSGHSGSDIIQVTSYLPFLLQLTNNATLIMLISERQGLNVGSRNTRESRGGTGNFNNLCFELGKWSLKGHVLKALSPASDTVGRL